MQSANNRIIVFDRIWHKAIKSLPYPTLPIRLSCPYFPESFEAPVMDALNDDNEKLRLGSSSTRDEGPRPRSESTLSDRTLLNMSDSENDEKRRSGDLEKEGLVEQLPKVVTKDHATKDPYARAKILMWMAINTLATVTIVSCHYSFLP